MNTNQTTFGVLGPESKFYRKLSTGCLVLVLYLLVNIDVHDDEENEWYDTMHNEVHVDEIDLDVGGIESELGGDNFKLNAVLSLFCKNKF